MDNIRVKGDNSTAIRLHPKCLHMKNSLLDEIKEIAARSKDWAELEIEYAKLTLAEKITMVSGFAVIGAVCLLLFITALIMFGISLSYLFQLIMCPALAYLASGGCILVLMALIFLVRDPLILNPIAKAMTKILLK